MGGLDYGNYLMWPTITQLILELDRHPDDQRVSTKGTLRV